MIQVPFALINLLNSSEQFIFADLFTFTRLNGAVLRYTSADIDILLEGTTNYCLNSDDMSQSQWVAYHATATSGTVTINDSYGEIYQAVPAVVGALVTGSVMLWGTPGKKINLSIRNGTVTIGNSVQITLTATPTRYSVTANMSGSVTAYAVLEANAYFGQTAGDSPQTINAVNWQVEIKPYATSYIATTSATATRADVGPFSSAMPIKRDTVSIKAGLEVDELALTAYPAITDLVSGVSFIQAVAKGMFDGAAFKLERAFFSPTWQNFIGSVIRFMGNVSDIQDFDRTQVPMTIKSTLELLNVKMPYSIYQAGCGHTLFDAGCALSKGSYGVGSSVLAGSTASRINCGLTQAAAGSGTLAGYSMGTGNGALLSWSQTVSVIPLSVTAVYVNGVAVAAGKWSYQLVGQQVTIGVTSNPALWYTLGSFNRHLGGAPLTGATITADITYNQSGYFDLGTVLFTSGLNAGSSRTVKSAGPGVVNFSLPLPSVPAVGDTFTIYPGCDKIQSTCLVKFNNLAHFNGCPFIPAAETAY